MICLTEWTLEQMIFINESAINEYTMNRKFEWSLIDMSAIYTQPLKRSEKWSILPLYIINDFIEWNIVQNSYNTELFNEFIRNWVIPSTNPFSDSYFILIINNTRIHRFDVYIISFLD